MDDDTESQEDAAAVVEEEDYYSILNLPRDVSLQESMSHKAAR